MSVYLGQNLLAGCSTNTISNAHSLFDCKWTDHILNEMAWLRSDTFSWQSGKVYKAAYAHLVADFSNATQKTETINETTITYYLAPDGHKIVTNEEADNVDKIYRETGVAWYYILNISANCFKLPRINPALEEYITYNDSTPCFGTGKTIGLTNNSTTLYGMTSNTNGHVAGADSFNVAPTTSGNPQALNARWGLVRKDQLDSKNVGYEASGIKADLSLAREEHGFPGKKYLYFYVGDYSISAIQQTAGLNSELFNGKIDLDAGNLNNTGKSLIAGLGMPSNEYIDITTTTSSTALITDYKAPANGYIFVNAKPNTASRQGVIQVASALPSADNQIYQVGSNYPGSYCDMVLVAPVKKGNFVTVATNATGWTSVAYARFIYAEGELS